MSESWPVRTCRFPAIKLRRANSADAEAVRALTREAYAKWIAVIGREPRPMTADYELAVRQHRIDLYELDGVLVALIEMVPKSDYLLIENVAVSAGHQGRGVGAALLEHAGEIAKAEGLRELRLYTNAAFTQNLAYYREMGFAESAREPLLDGGTMVHFAKPVS